MTDIHDPRLTDLDQPRPLGPQPVPIAHAQTYAHKLAEYPRWPEMEFIEDCVECHVPGNARPVDRSMEPA